jgi:hypothetical protein
LSFHSLYIKTIQASAVADPPHAVAENVNFRIKACEEQYFTEMDHIVTLDYEAKEIESLAQGTKSMIIYGSDSTSNPYGMITEGDILYFVYCDDCTIVKAKGIVSSVYNSYQLSTIESFEMIIRNQDKLSLPDNLFYKWAGKKYLVLVGVRDVKEVQPFQVRMSKSLNAGEWCPAMKKE